MRPLSRCQRMDYKDHRPNDQTFSLIRLFFFSLDLNLRAINMYDGYCI